MNGFIAGSRKDDDFPLMTLKELHDFLIYADIYITRPKDMPCKEYLGWLFNIFYHREGLLFIQLRRRTKEEKEESQVRMRDVEGTLLDADNSAFDHILVFMTHYRKDGVIHNVEAVECECRITVDEFKRDVFEKDGFRKRIVVNTPECHVE